MNLFSKRPSKSKTSKFLLFLKNYLSSNSRRLDIFDRVCVCRWLPLSLSVSLVHMVISKANWIVVDAINAPRSHYALGTLSLSPTRNIKDLFRLEFLPIFSLVRPFSVPSRVVVLFLIVIEEEEEQGGVAISGGLSLMSFSFSSLISYI